MYLYSADMGFVEVNFVMLYQAPDAIPRGLRGWGSKKDNMEIIWEVRHVQGRKLQLVSILLHSMTVKQSH